MTCGHYKLQLCSPHRALKDDQSFFRLANIKLNMKPVLSMKQLELCPLERYKSYPLIIIALYRAFSGNTVVLIFEYSSTD